MSTVQYNPFFGSMAQGELDLVMDTSVLARGAVGTWNALQGVQDPATFPALGLTTILSFFSGLSMLNRQWFWLQTSEEGVGTAIASCECARGAVLTAAGLTYIPIRVLGIWANLTTSKTYEVALGIFNQAGMGLFAVFGGLGVISQIISLSEHVIFRLELNALQDNFDRMTLINQKSSRELWRLFGSSHYEIVQDDAIDLAFIENNKHIFWTSVGLVVTIFATLSSVIPLVSADAQAVLVSSALNAATGVFFLIADAYALYKNAQYAGKGVYDQELFACVGATCIAALGFAAYLGENLVSCALTGTLGILWLGIACICMT